MIINKVSAMQQKNNNGARRHLCIIFSLYFEWLRIFMLIKKQDILYMYLFHIIFYILYYSFYFYLYFRLSVGRMVS